MRSSRLSTKASAAPSADIKARRTSIAPAHLAASPAQTPYGGRAAALDATRPGAYAAAACRARAAARGTRRRWLRIGRLFSRASASITHANSHNVNDDEREDKDDEVYWNNNGGGPLIPPLRPGDVIRDLPFFTQHAEVQFYSTHPSLLDDVFGLRHGRHIAFTHGAWAGQEAVVVGARGGALWVLLAAESAARELPLPLVATAIDKSRVNGGRAVITATSGFDPFLALEDGNDNPQDTDAKSAAAVPFPRIIRDLLCDHYGIQFPSADAAGVTHGTNSSGGAQESHHGLGQLPADLLLAAEAQARRLFSDEQRAFLQCAPDLFLSVVDETAAACGGGGGGMASGGGSPFARPHHDGVGGETDTADTRADSDLSFYQSVVASVTGVGVGTSSHRGGGGGGPKMVLLPPCVLAATGTVGWGGEGAVVVEGGGVRTFAASMSASVVV